MRNNPLKLNKEAVILSDDGRRTEEHKGRLKLQTLKNLTDKYRYTKKQLNSHYINQSI